MHSISSVCVFCGSATGNDPRFAEAARTLGALLATRGIGLVYGGASVGLMGIVADAVLAGGGRVVGVIPKGLADRELAHRGLTELHVVGSMHERKALMASRADAFVALPGGLGTLDELFEIVTWAQLGLHRAPIGVLDPSDYYAHLFAFLERAEKDGLVRAERRPTIHRASEAAVLLDAMAATGLSPGRGG
jgi:uncharacterized protein (TIGR00730 family)